MMFSLTKRPAVIGPGIGTRSQIHGEEKVPAVNIPVTGIFLDAEELNALLQDDGAHRALFTEDRSPAKEPRFMTIAPISLDDKFAEAKVSIDPVTGDVEKFELKPAKVDSIVLEPQVGGLTLMSCMIKAIPPAHTDVLGLLNQKIRLTIKGAALVEPKDDSQSQLGLEDQNQGEDGESSSEGGDSAPDWNEVAGTKAKKSRKRK